MELISKGNVDRLQFGDGGYVDLRAELTFEELVAISDAASRGVAEAWAAAFRIGVVGWSLREELTPENLGLPDAASGAAIKARMDELWSGRAKAAAPLQSPENIVRFARRR